VKTASGVSISRDGDDFVIEPEPVAARFGLSVEAFMQALGAGEIVAVVERGQDADAGRARLTFRRGVLLWRFILHVDGSVSEEPILAGRPASVRKARRTI
jgi:hypothetical protein